MASQTETTYFISADDPDTFDFTSEPIPPDRHEKFSLKVTASLTGKITLDSRTRYNCWNLLADVGGFHDGMLLVGSLFMSLYASLSF